MSPYNIAPVSASIPEDTLSGTTVADLSADNPESGAGQTIAWDLINSNDGRFQLSGSSVILNGKLDYEGQTQHTIEVR